MTARGDRDEHRHHLASVADVFLSGAGPDPGRGVGRSVYVAAPGTADTTLVVKHLAPPAANAVCHDLGAGVGVRLARWEREARLGADAQESLLVWCPRTEEGTSLGAGLVLGRLGALLCPRRLTVLWFADAAARCHGTPPDGRRRQVERLAGAAVPAATVALHCVGWEDPAAEDLAALGRRFA